MPLPIRYISIRQDEWQDMHGNVWSDRFYPAYHRRSDDTSRDLLRIAIRIRGGHTRTYAKKSYELRIGNKTIHMNAEYDDPSMMRNALSFRFLRKIGMLAPRTSYSRLVVNGRDMGVYHEIESVDRRFFLSRGIRCRCLIYATNDDANFGLISPETNQRKKSLFDGYKLILGGDRHRKQLTAFISGVQTRSGGPLRRFVASRFHRDNYLLWVAGAVLTGNYDGFKQNYALYQKDSKFRFIPWDYEGTWGRTCYGTRCTADSVSAWGYNALTKKLLDHKPVRTRYKQIVRGLLNNAFTEKTLGPEIERLYRTLEEDIRSDATRKASFSDFAQEPEVIQAYIRERRKFLLQELARR